MAGCRSSWLAVWACASWLRFSQGVAGLRRLGWLFGGQSRLHSVACVPPPLVGPAPNHVASFALKTKSHCQSNICAPESNGLRNESLNSMARAPNHECSTLRVDTTGGLHVQVRRSNVLPFSVYGRPAEGCGQSLKTSRAARPCAPAPAPVLALALAAAPPRRRARAHRQRCLRQRRRQLLQSAAAAADAPPSAAAAASESG